MSNFTETLKCPYRSPHAVVEAIQDIIKDKVVCELGCAYGDLFPSFMKYAKEVKGLDVRTDIFETVRKRGFNVTQGDWTKDPIPEAEVYYCWPWNSEQAEDLLDLLMSRENFEGTIIMAADASFKELDEVSSLERYNKKWNGELRRFTFNEGDGYRENGEFVLSIIRKKKTTFTKDGLPKKEKKNLVIILSHCDTPPKIKTLKETIASLHSVDVDILLTSHVPISSDIQDMVDYYIFDKSNPLISLRYKRLIKSSKEYLGDLDCFVKLTALTHDQWGGVVNQIIKAADVSLSLDYDYYSFVGYDVTFEEVHLKELNNPCPTEDIVTCEWGDSWIETKRIKNYCSFNKEDPVTETLRGQYASCDFNVMKKDCFKKIRSLLSLERYLEQDSSGNLLFHLAEEYWTSLVYLFKSRFVKEIQEKIELENLNQNYLDDSFKMFVSEGEERRVFFYDIEEPVKFRINNEKIIEVKDNHLEMDVKQIEYLTKDGPYAFSKELEESDSKSQSIELD